MSIKFLNKCNDSIKPNIFMQETEPEIKEGIWLQSNKEMNNIIIEDNMSSEPTFIPNKYGIGPSFDSSRQRVIVVGNDIYTTNYESLFYKLDTITKTWEKISATFVGISVHMAYKDGYIYMIDHWNSWQVYKYNITNKTFETVTTQGTHPSGSFVGSCVTINNVMYIMKENSNTWIKYDIKTSTFSVMPTLPFITKKSHNSPNSCTDSVNKIYAINDVNILYVYNIKEGTWTKLKDLNEIRSLNENIVDIDKISITPVYFNGFIYFYDSYKKSDGYSETLIFTYDLKNDKLEILKINIYNIFNGITGTIFTAKENELILMEGSKNTSIIISYKTFQDKTVVINQGNTYSTSIISTPKNIQGRLTNSFNNVWYNTKENGLDDTIPTYYGDGSKWIKFKN